jgi:hypothetical protein
MEGFKPLASFDTPTSYDAEYFSGAQIAVYIGDVWVDEITSFQMEVIQNKEPIYGYASELFDTIGRGAKLVRGAFTINYKEDGYLFAVLNNYRKKKGLGSVISPVKDGVVTKQNIEKILNMGPNDPVYQQVIAEMAGYSSVQQYGKEGLDKAEEIFNAFENAIWKRTGTNNSASQYSLQSRSPLHYGLNGFDIYISFGDFSNNRANSTVTRLDKVHLVGQNMAIQVDGRPIQEGYSFIARNRI